MTPDTPAMDEKIDGLKDGAKLSDEDQAAWMAYDPEQMLAYKRITAALDAYRALSSSPVGEMDAANRVDKTDVRDREDLRRASPQGVR